ncbi:hypothetical protein RHGRI_024872 [Rhododendron griersonianum]|uniref:Gag1-like clamp domain-containing protein n=1 Tax=Rhododendron griersonianum TaxID=479676 RepID=A0AAV6JG55_9ERIC|nr:hypothetical protein RHGRI_024872 [Rhododendron griersonianum]
MGSEKTFWLIFSKGVEKTIEQSFVIFPSRPPHAYGGISATLRIDCSFDCSYNRMHGLLTVSAWLKKRFSHCSWNATYESLLGSSKPFSQPVPLAEMVDFLVDIWEQEGMYD